jgi:hypothetical protein
MDLIFLLVTKTYDKNKLFRIDTGYKTKLEF